MPGMALERLVYRVMIWLAEIRTQIPPATASMLVITLATASVLGKPLTLSQPGAYEHTKPDRSGDHQRRHDDQSTEPNNDRQWCNTCHAPHVGFETWPMRRPPINQHRQ
jgi:hypothetical protein